SRRRRDDQPAEGQLRSRQPGGGPEAFGDRPGGRGGGASSDGGGPQQAEPSVADAEEAPHVGRRHRPRPPEEAEGGEGGGEPRRLTPRHGPASTGHRAGRLERGRRASASHGPPLAMIGRVDGGDSQQSFLTGADPNGAEANGSAPTGGAIDGARTDAAPTDAAPKVGTPTGRAPGGEGWTTSADPGTAAVLHGMMTMLSEVLEGLDRRLHALEEAVGDRVPQPAAAAPLSSADLAAELAPVTERLADLEQSLTALRDRPDPTSELVGELRQRLHRRD